MPKEWNFSEFSISYSQAGMINICINIVLVERMYYSLLAIPLSISVNYHIL